MKLSASDVGPTKATSSVWHPSTREANLPAVVHDLGIDKPLLVALGRLEGVAGHCLGHPPRQRANPRVRQKHLLPRHRKLPQAQLLIRQQFR